MATLAPRLPFPLLAPVVASLLALSPAARAAERGPSQEEGRIRGELSLGAVRLDYAEYAPDGAFLDGETGWIPSLAVALELRGGRGLFRAAARIAQGEVDYDGHVQSSDPSVNGLPARSVSDARFALVEAQAGAFVDPGRRVAILAGFAARRWDRDVRSTVVVPPAGAAILVRGLSEVYTWYELQAGLRWTPLRAGRAELELDARIVRTAGGTMQVDLGRRVALDLGGRTGFRGGAILRWALARDRYLALGGYAESYAFGQSPVVLLDPADPASGILEPRSETVGVAVDVGLGARF